MKFETIILNGKTQTQKSHILYDSNYMSIQKRLETGNQVDGFWGWEEEGVGIDCN